MESKNLLEELSTDEKAKYIIDKVDEIKDHFLMKAAKSKRLFYLYKNLSIVLAGITTILASLQVMYPQNIPLWLLPVISAATTISATLLGASSAQSIWTNSRTTAQRLQMEMTLFIEQASDYYNKTKEERIRRLTEQFIQIWQQGHNKWEQGIVTTK